MHSNSAKPEEDNENRNEENIDEPDGPGYTSLHNQDDAQHQQQGQQQQAAAYKERVIHFNQSSVDGRSQFKSNSISTTKYTVTTFWPKFMFEQFRKAPNSFFLVIALLQQIPGVSPTGRFTTAVPLGIIILLTAIKEVVEDWGRMRTDRKVNNSKTSLLRHGIWQRAKWKDIEVGDIVMVTSDSLLPADILLLSSSETKGICYIETANLDGETNLKVRQCLAVTEAYKEPNQLQSLQGRLVCEPPDDDMTKFKGSLFLQQERHAVTLNQLLMRGTCLRKTGFVIGFVVYTGPDTKVMKNSKPVPLKRSRVERESNNYFWLLLAMLAFFTLFATVANCVWSAGPGSRMWYIPDNSASVGHFFSVLVTCFITFHTIVPISLQVTLEFMRILQAYFIQCDLELYDANTDIAAEARTSSLNEELGQINFVFSDKTGTLTQNSMVFQGASVAGRCYGDAVASGPGGAYQFVSGVGELKKAVAEGPPPDLDLFLTVLTVCHTVIPEKDTADGSIVGYSASSPDESALVSAARAIGYELHDRSLDTFVTVRVMDKPQRYEILATFQFSSDRKRMSMVVRCPDDRIRVLAKGADSVIYERLANRRYARETSAHMQRFAVAGLRTLCIAGAEISADDWRRIGQQYADACNDVENRESRLAVVAEAIERNLHLLGATAIEDKLQTGVPDTINDLLLAGMRIWVLTGDKLETAINIGYSCRLLQTHMEVRTLTADSLDAVRKEVTQLLEWIALAAPAGKEAALVVEGSSLAWAAEDSVRADFLEVCLQCVTVICCRVSPKQKSDVVRYVREALPSALTLAIGDGANDVPMIQESHVGVGLKGKEGLQAAAASDYSLAQFRFLKKLLFVHGAWSYHRITIVILFSFYKNIAIYVTAFWFSLLSGFSGQVMFEKWTQAMYNVLFTGATPFALGVWDRSCSEANCLKYPQLYRESQGSGRYNLRVFALWMLNGVYHSAVIFVSSLLFIGKGVVTGEGRTAGLYYMGSLVYGVAVVTVGLKAGIEHTALTYMSHMAIWGGIVNYFLWTAGAAELFPNVGANFQEIAGFRSVLLSSVTFWALIVLISVLALTRDFAWKVFKRTYSRSLREEVILMEKLHKDPDQILFQGAYRKVTEKARLLRRALKRFGTDGEQPQPGQQQLPLQQIQLPASQQPHSGFAFSCDEHPMVTASELLNACPERIGTSVPPAVQQEANAVTKETAQQIGGSTATKKRQ